MDQKLVVCITSLKEEAEAARAGAAASDLNSLVADVSDFCKQTLSDEDVSFAIAVIFDRESGIFSILELLLLVKDRTVVKAKESCCTFLAEFIEQIGERSLPHANFVKEKCLHIFRRDESKAVQAAALSPVLHLFEIAGSQQNSSRFHVDWGFAEVLLHEYEKSKSSGNLRSNILVLLGYAIEYFPSTFQDENVEALVKMCLGSLEEQLHHPTKDPVFVLVSGLMKCLDSLLTWYDDSVPARGSIEISGKIYMYMIQVICYREDTKRYEAVKAGLRLLGRHAALFTIGLVQNCKEVLNWLQIYCTHANAQLRDVGLAAFDEFIQKVAQCLVDGDTRIQNAQSVYRHLMSTFLKILEARDMDSKLLSAFAVKGVGRLSPAILKFSGKDTLLQVSHRLIPFGGKTTKSGEDKDYLLGHSDTLVGAFADVIIHLDTVEDYMVSFIAEVTGNIFYQFPQLFPKQRKAIYVTLTRLFKSLYLKGTIFSIFLTNIVWSSLERTMESSDVSRGSGSPIWPDYVELWSSLLHHSIQASGQSAPSGGKTDTEKISGQDGDEQKMDLKLFQEFIFDTLIRCIMKALGELNLKYRVREIDKHLPPSSTAAQDDMEAGGVEPETQMDMIEPLNIVHMHKYLDLVEYIQGLLTPTAAHLFLKWVYPFGCCVMELSNHYPLISGNYKLLTTAMKIADDQGFFNSNDSSLPSGISNGGTTAGKGCKVLSSDRPAANNTTPSTSREREACKRLYRQFLRDILVSSRRYKFELLASCLRFCLSAPPALMDIGLLVAPIQTALRMGLRYAPLASVAVGTLESWRRLYPNELDKWLPQIVTFLNDYLADTKGSGDSESVNEVDRVDDTGSTGRGLTTPANLSRTQLARMRRTRAKANQPGEFEIIQLRVQKFLGQIGHYNHYLVPKLDLLQVSSTGGLAWDPIDRIQFTIPFRDEKYDIWLDSLLPRVVELALLSSDRKTKVAASELLQALCIVMLGNSAKGPMRRGNDKSQSVYLDKIYSRLFPAVFRLAVDVEIVSRQLFNEFAKQLIHWYTSNQQRENPETVALLDAILDGLVDADNGSLREYCAVCLGEFMSWSVRHAPPEKDDFVNVKSILRRLYNRMDHPNPYKRLGAAMAAYRIYPVLKATPSIVDRYILEMMFFCLKSLRIAEADDKEIGTGKQLSKTLDCYLRLVQRNVGALQKDRKDRAAFIKLEDFLNWLLTQTGHMHEKYRSKCMYALNIICRSLPGGSIAKWFRSKLNDETTIRHIVTDLDFQLDQNSQTSSVLEEAQQRLISWMRSLHWFTWALEEKLITTSELLLNTRSDDVMETFLQEISGNAEICPSFNAVTPAQRETHQKLKCSLITYLFGLIKQILEVEFGVKQKGVLLPADLKRTSVDRELVEKLVPLNEPKFHKLMCLALLRPRDLGFVITDPGAAEELVLQAAAVMQILIGFSDAFKTQLTSRLQALFQESKAYYDPAFVSLSLSESGQQEDINLEDAACLVRGYQQLHLSGSLLPALGMETSKLLGETLLLKVFEIERECPPGLESIASEMVNLSLALGTRIQKLVSCCLDDKPIASSSNTRKVTAGAIFYLNFRKVIVRRVKFSFKECSRLVLEAAVTNPTARLLLSAILDDFIASSEPSDKLSKGSFLKEMLRHVTLLEPCCSSTITGKKFLLEIIHKLLVLDTNGDLLQHDESALVFMEDTYLRFVDSIRTYAADNPDTTSNTKESDLSVQSQSLALLPFFFKAPFEQEFRRRLARAVSRVISDHLLVPESELLSSSNHRSSYLQILSRLLEALSFSGSVLLLETVFPLFLSLPKFAVNLVSDRLEQFAENNGESRTDAFDLCLRILNDESKVPKLRRAVVEKVFAPLVRAAPMDFVANWYSPRMKEFVEILQREIGGVDVDKEEEGLIVKICHYFLVEQLFLKLDTPTIKEKITPSISNAVLMKQTRSESRAKFDPRKPFPENSVLWRDLHISAYKGLAAVVMRTQEQEKIFALLFQESASGMIWQHLIDTEKVYDKIPVETSRLGATAQKLRGMRAKQKARSGPQGSTIGGVSTLSSQYFAGVGLSQEPSLITSFVSQDTNVKVGDDADNSDSNLTDGLSNVETVEGDSSLKMNNESDPVVEDGFDQDDFDLHPCMTVVLNLIETINAKFGVGQREMPEWMKGVHSTFQSTVTHVNIRLFLAKVIIKAWKVFAFHSQQWFVPLAQTILLNPEASGGRSFHYILRDISITMLQWKLTKPPDPGLASSLVNYLISVTVYGKTQVVRANVDVIRLLVGGWKDDLQIEKRTILAYLSAGGRNARSSDGAIRTQRIVGLQLLGVLVVSGFPMHDSSRADFSKKELYDALLQNLKFKSKEVYEASGELVGMVLKQRKDDASGLSSPLEEELLEAPLRQSLFNFIRESNLDCFINIMNKITLRFPQYIDGFAPHLIELLPNLHGIFKVLALDIFLRFPRCLLGPKGLPIPLLNSLLTHRDEAAQFRTVQLVIEVVKESQDSRIYEKSLPVLCETFATHENADCRRLYYGFLIYLYERDGGSTNDLIVRSLLVGLADSADDLRRNVENFWHSHLSQDLGRRLTEMLGRMYDPVIEESWAQFACVLLVKLCHDSVDFKRPMFNAPLSDCEFHDQTINTSWMGSSLPMTPLFSLSQSQNASQALQDSQSQVVQSSQFDNSGVPREGGYIRATMVPTLTQTQDTGTFLASQSQESSLFAMSRRVPGTQVTGSGQDSMALDDSMPRRRFLEPNASRAQIVRAVMNANRRREARASQQAEERGNKVQIMRKYRTGELPDIEIKYEEVLIPLAALAERDSTFARLLLTLMCRALYGGPSAGQADEHRVHDLKSSVKSGIELALQKTRNGISFVGCVEALCLEDPDTWVQPKLVGSASVKSTNFHSGILVLENEILHLDSNESAHADSSSKRQKGLSGAATQKASSFEEAWFELARLYHELGENDVVLSVYRKNLTKHSVTHKALEAQLAGEYNQGLILYDQALDGMDDPSVVAEGVSQLEQDMWYNQRLTCLVELNRWQQIVEDTLFQVQDEESSHPLLDRFWAPSVREPYLGLFLRGAVKVATYRSLATDFMSSSMEDPSKRDVLVTQFGSHVAQVAVLNEQFDLARFHLLHCYRTFRQQWSALHPLAVSARYYQVQKLQKMVELDEYVELMTSQNAKDIPRLYSLSSTRNSRIHDCPKLWEWRHRWPSPREDSVEAWDDIVQNRLVFFDKFQSLVNKLSKNSQSDTSPTEFATMLNEERAQMFSQAARGLIKHGAYNAAQRYMEEYISAHSKQQKLDYLSIKGLVKLRCLEASRIQDVQYDESIRMLQQVRSYIDAQKPAVDRNPSTQIGFALLEANVTVQLAFCKLSHVSTANLDPVAVNDCLSLLGAAYGAYLKIFSVSSVSADFPSRSKILQQLAKSSLKFGQFCDDLLKLTKKVELSNDLRTALVRGDTSAGLPPASAYAALTVKHIMKAIKLDTSIQARHGVARLLSIVGEYPETHGQFLDSVGEVPSWMFIPWIPQMLAAADQKDGEVFVGILEDIARSNPQALFFAYHVSQKDFGSTGQMRTRMLAQLLKDGQLQSFVRALEDLTFPEQRLRDGINQIRNCLKVNDYNRARRLFLEVAADCLDVQAMTESTRQAGEYNCKFARHWSKLVRNVMGEDGAALLHMDEKVFTASVTKDVMKPLQKASQSLQTGVLSLGHLSQWMARFDGSGPRTVAMPSDEASSSAGIGAIEIPGQYNTFNEPGNVPHVELMGFDQTLIALSSKQRPKVLTMRGSDENEYKFIVKGGEDIRLDQRIEQLFEVMNSILQRDAAAAKRGLSVRTYAVIPVSKSCGLLQFVDNTVVLEDVVKAGLVWKLPHLAREGKDAATRFLMKLRGQHQAWVAQKAGPSTGKHPMESFLELYKKASREDISAMLSSFQSQIPWDTFKAGVSRWATSAESYLALRSQFAKSLSVISICGYIAGVGDRHLGNTLVDMRSGSLVPIDFGYSFGTGVILLPVPELIPFRLTKQLTNFLLPLDALGLLRTDMIHTLSALHARRDVISAVMDVFVKEPLVDWKNEAMRINSAREKKAVPDEAESKDGQPEPNSEQEYVELKVENAQRKLQLWNPATIMVSELQSSVHANTPFLPAIEAMVLGQASHNTRACVNGEKCRSISEQVDCLIDQATDPNLLGRLWSGWQAWV